MTLTAVIKILFVGILAGSTIAAQTRAYAKFGSAGETIGLFQLMKEPERCENWRSIVGNVITARATAGEREVLYRFTVKSNAWTFAFVFELEKDEIPFRDVQQLLGSRRLLRIRGCRDGGVDWKANEIARFQ